MSPQIPPFPPTGGFIEAVRSSCRELRVQANITIDHAAIERLLLSPSFTESFLRLRNAHGLTLPLKFDSVISELNVLSLLSLLNFGSGYRIPFHTATGRGAFDNIRALIFSMFISSATGSDANLLSAKGIQTVQPFKIAELMGVAGSVHVESSHATIPGLTVGELGGPLWEIVQLITNVLNETGEVLVNSGYPDLGTFVLESLKEGEKVRVATDETHHECEIILERLVRGIPAFRDMNVVDGQPVYCFKKALLTLHAVAFRFGPSPNSLIPVPRTSKLPVFSDNVLPSVLIHLGIIDLSTSTPSSDLRSVFPHAGKQETIDALLAASSPTSADSKKQKIVPSAGPALTEKQAYMLRAAAVDACDIIVETAQKISPDTTAGGLDLSWLKTITSPEIDAWIWSVAKDRLDYRSLERFVQTGTICF